MMCPKMVPFLLLCVLQVLQMTYGLKISQEEHCNVDRTNKYVYFGTKTSYQTVRGNLSSIQIPQQCNAIRFWSMNRHGTRLPHQREIDRMAKFDAFQTAILNHVNQSRLCPKEVELLKRWKWKVPPNAEPQTLTSAGYKELKQIAQRYKNKFPQLLAVKYNENYFYFQHTNTSRTKQSFHGYVEGLFGENNPANAIESNKIINEDKSCAGWKARIKQMDTWRQYNDFKKGSEFQNLLRDVSNLLGFDETLNETLVLDMFNLCRFEKAWDFNNTSPWCYLFTKEQLKILEYLDDLSYYYYGGYGIKFNPEIGCPPVRDLFKRFEEATAGSKEGPKVTVYFSHSVPTLHTYTALDIFHDSLDLTSDNYMKQTNRKFRTSLIDAFASNIVAVLYECDGDDNKFMVQFLVNEKPVEYAGCTNGLCAWSKIKEKLMETAIHCDLKICNMRTKSTASSPVFYYINFLLVVPLLKYFY